MSDQEFFGVWKEEAKAALGAVEAGIIKNIWKVTGEYHVVVVLEVDSDDQIDEIMHSLPIWKLGYDYIIDMEWTLLRALRKLGQAVGDSSSGVEQGTVSTMPLRGTGDRRRMGP